MTNETESPAVVTGMRHEAAASVVIRIDEYQHHPRNYNGHPPEQIRRIQASLDEFGQGRSIVVWRNYVLAGHGVYESARQLGWEYLAARKYPDEWSETKAIAYLAADNRLAELGDPDMEALARTLEDIRENDLDLLYAVGYTDDEYRDLIQDLTGNRPESKVSDAEPEPTMAEILKAKWKTEPGQMWQLGNHYVICGDSTDPKTIRRLTSGRKMDMLLTDPPYGVSYADKNEFLNLYDKGSRVQTKIENDSENEIEFEFGSYSEFFARFLKIIPWAPKNIAYIFMSGQELHSLRAALDMADMKWGDYLIWIKNNHVLGRKDYNAKHEFIVYAWAGRHEFHGHSGTTVIDEEPDPKKMSKDELLQYVNHLREVAKESVLRFDRPHRSEFHPTQKPVELLERLLRDGSETDDAVIDPFCGSGSTLLACERQRRHCYGIEKDPGYLAVILERWSDATNKTPVKLTG